MGAFTLAQGIFALGNNWTFTCGTWDGLSGSTVKVYNSRTTNPAATLLDCDWTVPFRECKETTGAYGLPNTLMSVGERPPFFDFDYLGQIDSFTGWDGELTEEEVCLLCRCGVDNMQGPIEGQFNYRITHDRAEVCHQCTLPTGVTHCGPRRIM